MADELSRLKEPGFEALDQLLHGYADGHRLLQGSRRIPDDLSRLMLRMSDLSGSNLAEGFEEYFTGYPLTSLKAYALAKTWYAPEMPRPGCVWTHTLIIPFSAMARIRRLDILESLFKRPNGPSKREGYSDPIPLNNLTHGQSHLSPLAESARALPGLIARFYENDGKPLLLPSRTSRQFEGAIFALWSQQWPELRTQFTFCTGSLSARSYGKQPLDVQCVPLSRTREISLSISSETCTAPDVVDSATEPPQWAIEAANDENALGNESIRDFLWSVAGAHSTRQDFISFIRVFEVIHDAPTISELVASIASVFPLAQDGADLKLRLLRRTAPIEGRLRFREQDILFALATTDQYSSFDGKELGLTVRGAALWEDQDSAAWLLTQLFHASLNSLGEQVLSGLISVVVPETALVVIRDNPELLPTLFRAKPDLAASADLWRLGGDRKRELFESVANREGLDSSLVASIVSAMLETGAEWLIRRALETWGKDAVFAVLSWIDAHGGTMTEITRQALTFHVREVMEWIRSRPASSESLIAVAHIVAPYSYNMTTYETTVWHVVYRSLRNSQREAEATYVCTLLLALGLGNAPPAPLDLISESFERVHELAARNLLSDDAWIIMEPLVPELSWFSNWDKCERLRRALVLAFVRHRWTASTLRQVVRDTKIRKQILRSAARIDGGEEYFERMHVSE